LLKPLFARLTAIHVLLVVGVLEVAVNRLAVPMLRPEKGTPPAWHTALDYLGLFLFYFVGTLAALILITRSLSALSPRPARLRDGIAAPRSLPAASRWRSRLRDGIAPTLAGVAALLAAIPLVIAMPGSMAVGLEIGFAAAVIALVASAYGRGRDVGIGVGLPFLAVPLLLHTVYVIVLEYVRPEAAFDGSGAALAGAAMMMLCIAALITPYCFAPRPFAHAVTRPAPIVVAVLVAVVGMLVARLAYDFVAASAQLALGVKLAPKSEPRLALYLLAIATFAWTLASCALSPSRARRTVGVGLALVMLGGYAFKWPHHYLLPLLGLALIADAARRVRDEELELMPASAEAQPIADTVWSTYVGMIAQGLRRKLGEVHTLTMRGDADLASSVIVGDADGTPVRVRIERLEGSVIVLDVVLGREIDEVRGATLTVWAIPPRGLGVNPHAPPAAPPLRTGDAAFDERFRTRGSDPAFRALFDDNLRARAIASLDGWLAYWQREGLRYRVYPGRGAPLDHPMPLSDLALGRVPSTAERLVAVVELLIELAARALPPAPRVEPVALEPEAVA
jgi:hypothetical protein